MIKQKILIVDDSEMNRMILTDILEGKYEILEAEDGVEAIEIIEKSKDEFLFVLLDIRMPRMDGLEVLDAINKNYWTDRVVVVMISSDDNPDNINLAYNLGAFDYIRRPFDPVMVRKRIANTLSLYERQHDLEEAVKAQYDERQSSNDLMISILSHIVEFRNGESGLHIQNVRRITRLLLEQLICITDEYPITATDIELITMAAAIHDVGKISIPEEVLNKPGRLTDEEFEMMKEHTIIGAEMLAKLPVKHLNSLLIKLAYEICRWHHERFDGGGYPDGLKGDEIPITAQVVALADVYDALTSERCYKKKFSHEQALSMILNGECGAFNPLLLRCLEEISDSLVFMHEENQSERETLGQVERSTEVKQGHVKNLFEESTDYMKLLYVDSLTNIYNRRYFKEHVDDMSYIRAAAVVEINNLNLISEKFGQEMGDAVIKGTAEILIHFAQRPEQLMRYDGNEFLILFKSTTKDSFEKRLQEIKTQIEEKIAVTYGDVGIDAKIFGAYGARNNKELFAQLEEMLSRSSDCKSEVNCEISQYEIQTIGE